jgi:hypothetical protein
VILRRFENDVIFEELGHWNGMEAMANYVIGNMMAVVFEKYGMLRFHQIYPLQAIFGSTTNF